MPFRDANGGTSPSLPDGLADALERQEQSGGFIVLQQVEHQGYAILLGGIFQILLREAELAAARALSAYQQHDFAAEAGAASSALLCAAASCEARLSEHIAHYECIAGQLPPELEAIRQLSSAREQWRELLRFSAPTFQLGDSKEYLAMGCLFRVRDLVAHRAARLSLPGAFPSSIVDCVRQGAVPVRNVAGYDWTSALFVHEVARWSVGVTQRWLDLADRVVPIHC